MSRLAVKANERVTYVGSTIFTLDKRFQDFKLIGQGSYGVVASSYDSQSGKKVAIKKISPMSKHIDDAKHVLREIRIMKYLGIHENIITLEDLIVRETNDELYLILELLDSDLHRIIQSKQMLTSNHIKYFFFQLICGVKFLHDNRIIHRDLKPGNLLVAKDCKLRITDFGLARERPLGSNLANDDDSIDVPMTEHVVTRWYRPPELMLCPDGLYTYAIDMWSCGCILGELLGRNPMFPGKNFIHQLTLIFDMIGSPKSSEVHHIQNQQARKFLDAQLLKSKVPFDLVYPKASYDAIEVLDQLLVFDPQHRLSATEVLNMPYLSAVLTSPAAQASMVFPTVSTDFEFNFERMKLTKSQLKNLIIKEGTKFRDEKSRGMSRPIGSSNPNSTKSVNRPSEKSSSLQSTGMSDPIEKEKVSKEKLRSTDYEVKRTIVDSKTTTTTNERSRSASTGMIRKPSLTSNLPPKPEIPSRVDSMPITTRTQLSHAEKVTETLLSQINQPIKVMEESSVSSLIRSPDRPKKSLIIEKNITPTKPVETNYRYSDISSPSIIHSEKVQKLQSDDDSKSSSSSETSFTQDDVGMSTAELFSRFVYNRNRSDSDVVIDNSNTSTNPVKGPLIPKYPMESVPSSSLRDEKINTVSSKPVHYNKRYDNIENDFKRMEITSKKDSTNVAIHERSNLPDETSSGVHEPMIPPKDEPENRNDPSNDKKKKKLTVAKSPKFSKMSWERKNERVNKANDNRETMNVPIKTKHDYGSGNQTANILGRDLMDEKHSLEPSYGSSQPRVGMMKRLPSDSSASTKGWNESSNLYKATSETSSNISQPSGMSYGIAGNPNNLHSNRVVGTTKRTSLNPTQTTTNRHAEILTKTFASEKRATSAPRGR